MRIRRKLNALVLCLSVVGLQALTASPAVAGTCTEPVGDIETGCLEETVCLIGSKLGWACVE